MTFLQCVNRIFQLCALIRGDTDTVTSFSDTQHNAAIGLAQVCVQDELTNLIADRLIPYERKTSGVVTLVASTRTYALASDFLRFYGSAHFKKSDNTQVFEWPGGQEALMLVYPTYQTDTGTPTWWYWEPTTTKQIGFFQVPNASGTMTYQYEGSVMVSSASDTMPFHNNEENYMFTAMAGRRFKYMFEDVKNQADIQGILDKDMTYRTSKASLMNLIKGQNPSNYYARHYA